MDDFIAIVFVVLIFYLFFSFATFIVTGKSIGYRFTQMKYTNYHMRTLAAEAKTARVGARSMRKKMLKMLDSGELKNEGIIYCYRTADLFDYFVKTKNPKLIISAWPDEKYVCCWSIVGVTDDGEVVALVWSDDYDDIHFAFLLADYIVYNKSMSELKKLFVDAYNEEVRIQRDVERIQGE